jgi:uncharacterized protein YhaN
MAQMQGQKERLEGDLNLARKANEGVKSELSEALKEIERLSTEANQQIASVRLNLEAESQKLFQTVSELKSVRAEKGKGHWFNDPKANMFQRRAPKGKCSGA